MKIAITGGTGFVGGRLATRLAGEGHDVVLVARGVNVRDPGVRLVPGVTLVRASVVDVSRLADAFSGCEAVAHLSGITEEKAHQTFDAVHVKGTINAVSAAEAQGVRRFALLGPNRARPGTGSAFHESKWAAEEIVRASRLDYTVARAGVIYGKGDHFIGRLASGFAKVPVFLLVGSGRRVVRPVAVEDVTNVLAASLTSDRLSRSTVRVVGPDEIPLCDAVRLIAAAVDRRPSVVHVPGWLHGRQPSALERLVNMSVASRSVVVPPWADHPPPDLVPRRRFTIDVIHGVLPMGPGGGDAAPAMSTS